MRFAVIFTILCSAFFHVPPVEGRDREAFVDGELPKYFMTDSLFTDETPVMGYKWWESFGDSILDSLVTLAVKNNPDVFTAIDNIIAARASLRTAQSAYYPNIGVSAGWSKSRGSRTLNSGSVLAYADVMQEYLFAKVNASWEIDLFGKIITGVKSARYSYEADIETYNATILSLICDMATYYAELRTLQQQYIVAEKNIASQRAIMEITEVRYNTGLASQLDVAQAKSVYFSTHSSVPPLVSAIRQQINAITVLAGLFPPQLYDWLSAPEKLPDYARIIPVGTPELLLEQRPDIVAARNMILSAKAAVNKVRSNFAPTLSVNGSFGFASHNLNRLFNNKSITYDITPQLNWNIFQGAATFNALKSSKAEYDAAIRNYNALLQKGVQETDNAMAAYTGRVKQVVELKELVVQGEITLKLSLDLYKRGLTNFQNVLDAQRSLLEYQNSLVSAQGNALSSLISLYRATGGGWENYGYDN